MKSDKTVFPLEPGELTKILERGITEADRRGPTLNPSYNELLRHWAATGHPTDPQCEICGKDVTGLDIHDSGYDWRCDDCQDDPVFCTDEDDRAERFYFSPREPASD